ncbi:unnamed protein product [Dibothriocephalus latus]|uniref:Uncharacterized protein n=1 Tax=Dibothriocephalus latus TaxID=60516 RepID=A0A3P7LUN8_DIBLA|nr:unnamed protein product [Dibothriocephalus latus]
MSVIDHQRPQSASRRNKLHFFTLRSSKNSRSSERPSIFNVFPDTETELSLVDLNKSNDADGRCLRIFCEKIKEGTCFKTICIKDTTTVGECIDDLTHLIFEPSEIHKLMNPESLVMFEAVGRIKQNPGTASQSSAGELLVNTEFTEVSSHPLVPNQRVMDVFSLMKPASGLSRRLELRPKQPPARTPTAIKSDRLSPETTYFGQDGITPLPHSNGADMSPDIHLLRNKYFPTKLANQPHLLLLKGSRPERDSLMHDLSPLFNGSKVKLSIGLSSKDDIRLYLPPGSNRNKSGTGTASPVSLCIREVGTRKSLCLVIPTQWNLPQCGDVITVFHNWFDVSRETPVERYLQPGDILRLEARQLAYIFLFKDPSSIPEHELKLGFLSLPPTSSVSESLIGTPSSNRVNHVLQMLFPDGDGAGWMTDGSVTFIMTKPWPGLPNVTVAAACYAHLTRSTVIAYAAAHRSEKQVQRTLEYLLGAVGSTLTNEIDALESSFRYGCGFREFESIFGFMKPPKTSITLS